MRKQSTGKRTGPAPPPALWHLGWGWLHRSPGGQCPRFARAQPGLPACCLLLAATLTLPSCPLLPPFGSRPPPGTCRQAHLQRLDILINGEPVDALARVVHRDKAQVVGRRLCAKLRVSWGPGQGGD